MVLQLVYILIQIQAQANQLPAVPICMVDTVLQMRIMYITNIKVVRLIYCFIIIQPPVIRSCGAPDCTDLCYYDPSVGEFDYCSPSCRDKHLLPKEKKALQDDLKAFECQVKQIVLPLTGEKRGTGPPAAGEESEHRSTQASGGRGSCSAAALSSSTQATSPPTGSGITPLQSYYYDNIFLLLLLQEGRRHFK